MSKFTRKAQLHRENPQRPMVFKTDSGYWQARVYDTSDEFHVETEHTLSEAYAKACKLAALVEKQRFIKALASSPSKAVGP